MSHSPFFCIIYIILICDVIHAQAAIDLDQKTIESELAKKTEQGQENALKVYAEGAFSQSYAEITLSNGVGLDVAKDTEVYGRSAGGKMVRGKIMNLVQTGEPVIEVQYHASPVQTSWTDCHVGGNPEPNTNGCK